MKEEFEALWQDFIDGTLDADRFAALERMLREDRALCAQAAELYAEQRLLGLALRPDPEGRFVAATVDRLEQAGRKFSDQVQLRLGLPSAPARPLLPRWLPLWLPLVAAACLMLAIAVFWRWAPASGATAAPEHLATLVGADDCTWADAMPRVAGRRLAAGPLRLTAGRALVRFDGGALALLNGPVEFAIDSAGSATLARGAVTVRISEQAAGFSLHTPASEVVDLGTEFAVAVAIDGVTTIQVLDGEVELHPHRLPSDAPSTPPARLRAGQALRLRGAADAVGESIPFTAQRLEAGLARVAAGPDTGRLLAYEGFAYRMSRTYSNQGQAAGGFGWKGAWFRNSPETDLEILFGVDASLEPPAGLVAPVGGHLVLPAEPERPDTYRFACMRRLATPIDPEVDGETYVSVLIRRSSEPAGPTHHWLRCMLISERVPRDRMGFGVLSDFLPHVAGQQGNVPGATPIVAGRPYLFVAKLVTSRTAPDQMFLKVYAPEDTVDRDEPERWSVVGRSYRLTSPIEAIHIYNGTECGYAIDELRIGTSWRSVTPRH